MHDLAEQVAGDECFRIENGSRREVPRDVRHLFVANEAMAIEKIFELENLRTLIIDDKKGLTVNKKFYEKVFEKLQKLRVLAVDESTREETSETRVLKIPTTIGHLKHLRYLALVMGDCKLIFPRTLNNLYHLQVLIFYIFSDLEFSPDINTGNLTNLRHIIGNEMKATLPNVSRLTSLQTLESFLVSTEHGYELKQLRDLNKLRGKLSINGLENVESKREAHEARLADKKRLTGLQLHWSFCTTCTPEVQAEVLEGLRPPKDLKSLHIWNYHSLRYPNWMVGEQNGGPKYLHKLWLIQCCRLEAAPELFDFFVHLRELVISGCNWDHLPENVKDLRSLKSLKILSCLYLKSLVELPRSLQKFSVHRCNEVFMSSCKQIGHPNWQKIQHVDVKEIDLIPDSLINSRGMIQYRWS